MGYVKQALSGVDVEKREVSGFLGLAILNDVFQDYENRLTQRAPDVRQAGVIIGQIPVPAAGNASRWKA